VLDHSKLLKCLRLTASPHDGEALSAVRQANKMLGDAGLEWSQVVATPHEEPKPLSRAPVMFRGVSTSPPLGTWAETAEYLLSACPLPRDKMLGRGLSNLVIRLRAGGHPDQDEGRALLAAYVQAGGHVRQ
jgi:hypothetical protein